MKKLQKIGGSLASVALLLTLSAILWDKPTLAQSAPATSSPQTDTSNGNNLWWLLLIPVGGLVWSIARSRQRPKIESTVTPPIVPNAPIASAEPLVEANRSPQIVRVEETVVTSNSRQQVAAVPTDRTSTALTGRDGDEHIRLLEERLVVDLQKRKIGEVVVRKEIETRIVRVPIRREILIVEQISPEFKQLAVVDLGQPQDAEAIDGGTELSPTIAANFTSPTAAIEFLKSIADRGHHSHDLQMNIVLKDADAQAFYQQWLEHRSLETNGSIGGRAAGNEPRAKSY